MIFVSCSIRDRSAQEKREEERGERERRGEKEREKDNRRSIIPAIIEFIKINRKQSMFPILYAHLLLLPYCILWINVANKTEKLFAQVTTLLTWLLFAFYTTLPGTIRYLYYEYIKSETSRKMLSKLKKKQNYGNNIGRAFAGVPAFSPLFASCITRLRWGWRC